ncbi:MAG: VTT domain-containing protein [Acidobacteriaceae bacterium]
MIIGPIALLHKFSAVLLAVLKPLGIWGVGGLALIDSALIPIPGGIDGILTFYVVANPKLCLVYCLIGAAAAAIGSLVPFYIGRAGGELFLMKRINRERYEQLRDRFERQEFLAILIPSMGPPPTPLKLFQFAAGVFEMRLMPFLLATFAGKFAQFLIWSLLVIWFGPTIMHSARHVLHQHSNILMGVGGVGLLVLGIFVVRRVFDRRKGLSLPVEE